MSVDEPVDRIDPIGPNIAMLRRTLELVEGLTDGQYVHVEARLTQASIGAHVRHVLDHYRLFLDGLPLGAVDYDARERDTLIEHSPQAAAAEVRRLIAGLAALSPRVAGAAGLARVAGLSGAAWMRPLSVRQQGDDEPGRFDGCESHALRELLFLQSHAVHHHALIALLARAQGLSVPETFGLAPSTVSFACAH